MSQTPRQLRRTGWIVLACGLLAAVIVFAVESRTSDASEAFRHTRSADNQMGRMMGHFGVMMTDWQMGLTSPAGYALEVAAVAALLAGYFFRVASIEEEEQRSAGE